MRQACLVGIDVGTSGVKVLLLAPDGRILATAVEEYPLYMPQAGWTEQEPADWWAATASALRKVLAGDAALDIQAIGLSGQMHGMVALDTRMQVVRRAILWNDQRTERQCRCLLYTSDAADE